MRVLVVEGDDLIRILAVDTLEDAGFEVIEAATAEEALDRCEEGTADLLFTDIMLSGTLDGWDVAERCRENNPRLPVIYTTGYLVREHRPVAGSRMGSKALQGYPTADHHRRVDGLSSSSDPRSA